MGRQERGTTVSRFPWIASSTVNGRSGSAGHDNRKPPNLGPAEGELLDPPPPLGPQAAIGQADAHPGREIDRPAWVLALVVGMDAPEGLA